MKTNNQLHKICLIEDDPLIGEALSLRFDLDGYAYDWFKEGKPALEALKNGHYVVVISDINLPDISGERIFSELLDSGLNLPPFIFITGYASVGQAVRLLKLGASDYLTKPFEIEELLKKIDPLLDDMSYSVDSEAPLGVSPSMQSLETLMRRLINSDIDVLITGETGVGKECVAQKLHYLRHKEKPFIAVNCAAFSDSLLETELFGHEKGAFTGASSTKKGVFERAEGGTLFLDEIGDMPLSTQVKVLRAIQEKTIVRVGGVSNIPVDAHLISATHKDLKDLVREGLFREDLYYRINAIELAVPPLRDRTEDITWLARRFLDAYSAKHHNHRIVLSASATAALLSHLWPGNIRELKHCLERACVLSSSNVLTPETLFGESTAITASDEVSNTSHTLNDHLADCEYSYLLDALTSNNWEIQKTADYLGCSRKTLWEKMRKHDIKRKDF